MELPNYSKKLLQQLHLLQKKQQFSDCTILIGVRQFKAHKLVLASSSSLFKSLLQNTETISIDSAVVGPEEFTLLLEMMYSGKLPPGKYNFSRLISAADSLHMVDMSTSCKDILANLMGQHVMKSDQVVQVNVLTHNGMSKDQTAECSSAENSVSHIQPVLSESSLTTLPSKQSTLLAVAENRSPSLNLNSVDLSTAEKDYVVTEEEQISNVAEGDVITATTLNFGFAPRERKEEEEEDEDTPVSKRGRFTLEATEEREIGQDLEFLIQHQKSVAETFRNSHDFLEKVKQSLDISTSEKQAIFECCEGGDEQKFERLLERARSGKSLTASTLLSLLDVCQGTNAKISAILDKQNTSELEETGMAGAPTLLEDEALDIEIFPQLSPALEDVLKKACISPLIIEALPKKVFEKFKVIFSCCKGESHRGAIQKLLDQVEQEKVLSPESLLHLLHSVKEAFPDLQLLLNRIGKQTVLHGADKAANTAEMYDWATPLLRVKQDRECFKTALYRKDCWRNNLLTYDSMHPRFTFRNIVKEQGSRVSRLCTEETVFEAEIEKLEKHFMNGGYSQTLVRNVTSRKAEYRKGMMDLLLRSNLSHDDTECNNSIGSEVSKTRMIFTYSNNIYGVCDIIKKNWNILKTDEKLAGLVGDQPNFGFRRNKNLKNILGQEKMNEKKKLIIKEGKTNNMFKVIEEILKGTEDTEGIDVLLSAALKNRMLSSLSLWKFLLSLREIEPALAMLFEEIRKEPEAEQLIQAVTDKENRAVKILMRQRELITDAINDMDIFLECLTSEAEGLPESTVELIKGCCDQKSPTESIKKILHEILEEKSISAVKFCAVLYTMAESFPNLQSVCQAMECAELLKETDEDFEEEENMKEKKVLVSNEETIIEIDEGEIFEPEKTEGNIDNIDDQESLKTSICRKGRRDALSSKQNYSCKFCNKSFTFNCRLEVHLRRCRTANQKPITCDECGESKASKADMEAHRLEVHGTTPVIKSKKKRLPVTCNICGKGFAHPSGMQYHKRTEHFDEKPFFCQECGAKFAANSTLKNHMRLHTGERPYFCKHCDMTFTQAAALAYHNKKKHSEGKMYGCQYCDAVFAQSIELTRHVRTHTGDKPYVCRECGKGFSQANGLSVHLRTFHNIEDPYDCQKCRMSFPTMEEHRKHIQEFHSKEYNPCDTCGKIFSAPSLLERHVVTHIGGKPYNCDLCNKAYQQLSGLWYHNRTHHPDIFAAQNHRSPKFSSLQCLSCEKGFSTITSLNKHMKTEHADLKLLECGKCSELFSTQASLEVHTKYKHSGSQPFRCMYCSASFRYLGALQHHINTDHFSESDSTYGCEVCGELFTTQQTLEKHYETEHHRAFSEAQTAADISTETTQVVQVIQTSEQGASTEQLITLGDTQLSTSQLFVALPESQSSPPGSELVAVNMEDLLDGTVTLICRDAQ
ncbi:zinc finger and BTB domain-containing protein 40 [Protopterus annectens]|uniref:zinc finger and BTB domain-containing protein 40 n=1 Tax=Protopterus annectens TaxID=7888 RepID=UPI001CFA68D7|nr:zinc finger and BTB domain-containing protein 40 [Protopterus annectens]